MIADADIHAPTLAAPRLASDTRLESNNAGIIMRINCQLSTSRAREQNIGVEPSVPAIASSCEPRRISLNNNP